MSEEQLPESLVRIICPHCIDHHSVFNGLDTPLYWCGEELFPLRIGDLVYVDDPCDSDDGPMSE